VSGLRLGYGENQGGPVACLAQNKGGSPCLRGEDLSPLVRGRGERKLSNLGDGGDRKAREWVKKQTPR